MADSNIINVNGKKLTLVTDDEDEVVKEEPRQPLTGVDKFLMSSSDPISQIYRSYQGMPDFREDSADVSLLNRGVVKATARSPKEEVSILNRLGENATLEGGVPRVDGKVFDDPTMFSVTEIMKELGVDNLDSLLTIATRNPKKLALQEAAISILKEKGRSDLLDQAYNFSNPIVDTGTAMFADDLTKGLPGTRGTVKKGLNKLGFGDRISNITREVMEKANNSELKDKAIAKGRTAVENFVSKFSGMESLARELGATTPNMRRFKVTSAAENVAALADNADFKKLVLEPSSMYNKLDGAISFYDKTSKNIGNYYKNSKVKVNVDDLLDNDFTKAIKGVIEGTTEDRDVRKEIGSQFNDYVINIAEKVLPVEQVDELLDGGKITKELLEAIKGKTLSMADAANLRMRADSKSAWGRKLNESRDEVTNTIRSTANSYRNAIEKAIENSGDTKILQEIKDFHNLMPLIHMIDNKAAEASGRLPSVGSLLPGVINTPARFTASLIKKMTDNPAAMSFLRRNKEKALNMMSGVPKPESISPLLTPDNVIRRGGTQLSGSEIAENLTAPNPELYKEEEIPTLQNLYPDVFNKQEQLQAPMNFQDLPQLNPMPEYQEQQFQEVEQLQAPMSSITPEDVQFLQKEQETPKLPRDPKLLFSNPAYLDAIGSALQPDTFRMLEDAVESGSNFKMQRAMTRVFEEAPDYFEKPVTGNRSEVAINDTFVITDPMEAEVYRQEVLSKYDSGELNSKEAAKQLSALNSPRDMKVIPKIQPRKMEKPVDKVSPLQNIQAKLKGIGERREYDY